MAAQLIAQDENECEIQIARLDKLKTMPQNRAGYLRRAITNRYRDTQRPAIKEETGVIAQQTSDYSEQFRKLSADLAGSVQFAYTYTQADKAWDRARAEKPDASPQELMKLVDKILQLNENAA